MNSALAQTTLLHLARLGVREICVAAGARNTPLITAVLASRGLRVWHFFEERCAGYFALGRTMITKRPTAVLTTSGTAAAELLPAVIEAYYQGQPLVLVTADRPSRYRGSGAPQSIEQVGLFGGYAEPTIDLEGSGADAAWPKMIGRKPVHVNVCFDEPLVGESAGVDFSAWDDLPSDFGFANVADVGKTQRRGRSTLAEERAMLESYLADRTGLVVLASGLHPADAVLLAPRLAELGVPIVAEATANLLGVEVLASLLVTGGEKALSVLNPKRVLRIGAVPSWRWWRDLESRPEVSVVHVSQTSFAGLARWEGVGVLPLESLVTAKLEAKPKPVVVPYGGVSASDVLSAHSLAEPSWMRHLATAMPDGATVLLGNSLPIREWNLAAVGSASTTSFYANRGANGIDGLVSTFLGLSVDGSESWLILGDLSAMYDLAAPWILNQLPAGNRRIVVINNGGGKIFSRVKSLCALPNEAREVIENRHTQSFEPWAKMWSMSYRLCKNPSDLEALPDGAVVIEVRPDAAQTEAFWSAWG
jgi:2-succinyl-5-enolpyruvyl-6-hydroxy-3-cyclohexene-1-carboxylate synthase